ncbi:MAG: SDR family oxidoreductase, partial [Planctomycetes bacterium]|nr:SDR family oxidoreductase [Planctomycetota bacterium]
GAGKGIGMAIAKLLAANGAAVGVNALHEESASSACRELTDAGYRATAVPADVSDRQAVDAMISAVEAQLGDVDILVNNAAAPADMVPFEKTTPEIQDNELVTFLGVIYCTRRVLRRMIEAKAGRIINISSVACRHGAPGRAIYSGANAGIEVFSRALALEVGQYGITVNCVSPGATESQRFKARSEQLRRKHRDVISLDRFAEPEEIAQAVLFFASDMANYVTAATIDVDGGFAGYLPFKPTSE